MINLQPEDAFRLGRAYLSFRMNEIDQGVHELIPMTNTVSGLPENEVFRDLTEDFKQCRDGVSTDFCVAIEKWVKKHDIPLRIGTSERKIFSIHVTTYRGMDYFLPKRTVEHAVESVRMLLNDAIDEGIVDIDVEVY